MNVRTFALQILFLVTNVAATAGAQQTLPADAALQAQRQKLLGELSAAFARPTDAPDRIPEIGERLAALDRQLVELERQNESTDGKVSLQLTGTLNWLANQYQQRDSYAKAIAARKEALKHQTQIFGDTDTRVVEARLALAACIRVSELSSDDRKRLRSADRLRNHAISQYRQSEFRDAIRTFEECLAVQQAVLGDDDFSNADVINWLAVLSRTVGEYDTAVKYFDAALNIRRAELGEDHHLVAKSIDGLAVTCKDLGEFAKAEPLYLEALTIRQKLFGLQHAETATSLNNLGVFYLWKGNYAAARRSLQQAMDITRIIRGDVHIETAIGLANFALLDTVSGDYNEAEQHYRQAIAISEQVLGADHIFTARMNTDLGLLYLTIGDTDQAEPLFDRSLQACRAVLGERHADTARLHSHMGMLQQQKQDFDAATTSFRRSISIRAEVLGAEHPETAAAHLNLGRLFQAIGSNDAAETEFKTALSIHRRVLGEQHMETSASLSALGLLALETGRRDEAEIFIRESLRNRRQLLEATAAAQTERQQLLMKQNVRGALDDWLSVVDDAAGYDEVLRWKGSVFARQAASRAVRQQPGLRPLVEELRSASGRLARVALAGADETSPDHQARLRQLSDERRRLEVEVMRQSHVFQQSQELVELTSDALRTSLPDKTALVDFLEYDRFIPATKPQASGHRQRQMVAFIVRADQDVQRVELGAAAPIDELVDAYRRILQNADGVDAPVSQPGRRLRSIVWEPLRKHLTGIDTVLISPDGSPGKLPFAALPGEMRERYLIEDLTIAVIPVPQTLIPMQSAKNKPSAERTRTMLILGGINYGDEVAAKSHGRGQSRVWSSLEHSKAEGAAIKNQFEEFHDEYELDAEATFLQRTRPTEQKVRELVQQSEYLHFATHGYFDAEATSALDNRREIESRGTSRDGSRYLGTDPRLLSAIVLAGANQPNQDTEDDGYLTALEVADMDLSGVRLAVLSACETGLGRVAGGEGLLGLQRAFQLAGARTVVATLWEVDDDATRDLMSRFYAYYWNLDSDDRLSAIECLRRAQLELLNNEKAVRGRIQPPESRVKKTRTPPLYWAPFVLSGDWR